MHALALRWDGGVVGNAIPSFQTHQSNGCTSFGLPKGAYTADLSTFNASTQAAAASRPLLWTSGRLRAMACSSV